MNYVELIEGGLFNRNKIVPVTEVKKAKGTDCFRSLYVYTEDLLKTVEKTKTVTKYEGLHSTDAIVFDFDGDDKAPDFLAEFTLVRDEVIRFVEQLFFAFDLDPDSVFIFFSGNKGFHVVLPFQVISEENPFRVDYHKIYRQFVEQLTDGYTYADTSIYNPMRVMRISNTKHSKSGLYKIPIDFNELKLVKPEGIRKLAEKQRTLEHRTPITEMVPCPTLDSIWRNTIKIVNLEKIAPVKVKEKTEKQFLGSLFATCKTGSRHEALSKIAGYLIDKNVGYDEALGICKIWDNNNATPMGDERLEKDLTGMYRSYWDKRPQTQSEELPIEKIMVFGDGYTSAYQNHIQRITKFGRMKLGYPIIDQGIRGMIGGEVGVIVGKTSVGKSAFAQNILLNNVEEGRRVLFFSLEMPVATVAERNIQMMLNKSGRQIERDMLEGHPFIEQEIAEANRKLENFVTIPVQGIKYDLIEKYIHQTEDYFGEKIDLTVIDYAGLIKFEGGSLYEQQSGIAKDLKALAGRTDTGIITLAQVSKQYKDTDPLDLDSTRDSGVVVEASDYVFGLWRANRENAHAVCLDGGVLKNRNGSRIDYSAYLNRTSLRYKVTERDQPVEMLEDF